MDSLTPRLRYNPIACWPGPCSYIKPPNAVELASAPLSIASSRNSRLTTDRSDSPPPRAAFAPVEWVGGARLGGKTLAGIHYTGCSTPAAAGAAAAGAEMIAVALTVASSFVVGVVQHHAAVGVGRAPALVSAIQAAGDTAVIVEGWDREEG